MKRLQLSVGFHSGPSCFIFIISFFPALFKFSDGLFLKSWVRHSFHCCRSFLFLINAFQARIFPPGSTWALLLLIFKYLVISIMRLSLSHELFRNEHLSYKMYWISLASLLLLVSDFMILGLENMAVILILWKKLSAFSMPPMRYFFFKCSVWAWKQWVLCAWGCEVYVYLVEENP